MHSIVWGLFIQLAVQVSLSMKSCTIWVPKTSESESVLYDVSI